MTKRMKSNFRRAQILGLTLSLLLFNASCGQYAQNNLSDPVSVEECSPDPPPPPRSAFRLQDGQAAQTSVSVTEGVGKVIASGQGSKDRTIFVIEERHDSIVGQLEIAVMLWRLQKNHGLRQVSLEGALSEKGDLPAKWFHDLSGDARAGRETALSLLREGEISAAEFIALVQPAVRVKGNEVESEYNVEPSKSNGALVYLVGIAEKSLTQGDIRRVNALIEAKKIEEALDIILNADPWAKGRYERLYGDNVASAEESVGILREIEAKATEKGVKFSPQQESELRADVNFYRTASKRSCTMVRNTLAMDAAGGAPVALIIGAAHTPKVVELLTAAQVSYAVISPLALSTPKEGARLTAKMYQRKMNLKSVDGEGMLGSLLSGRKKLPSVLGKKWFQSKSGIFFATDRIVAAAAGGGPVPSDELRKELENLGTIKIDLPSIKVSKDGNEVAVMFKVTAETSDTDPQQTVTLWVGGWQPPPTGPTTGTTISGRRRL